MGIPIAPSSSMFTTTTGGDHRRIRKRDRVPLYAFCEDQDQTQPQGRRARSGR